LTSHIAIASTFVSHSSIPGYSAAILRASRTISPDVSRITFGFSTSVTVG
jgi:hypothetical protein